MNDSTNNNSIPNQEESSLNQSDFSSNQEDSSQSQGDSVPNQGETSSTPEQTLPQPNSPQQEKLPFYKKTWFLILMCIFVPFVGLILLFAFHRDKSKGFVITVGIITSIWLIVVLFNSCNKSSDSTSSSSPSASASPTATAQPSTTAKADTKDKTEPDEKQKAQEEQKKKDAQLEQLYNTDRNAYYNQVMADCCKENHMTLRKCEWNENVMFIEVNNDGSFGKKLKLNSAKIAMSKILETLSPKLDVTVDIDVTTEEIDDYGNGVYQIVASGEFTPETVHKINFDTFDDTKINRIADEWFVRPELQQYDNK